MSYKVNMKWVDKQYEGRLFEFNSETVDEAFSQALTDYKVFYNSEGLKELAELDITITPLGV